MAPKKIQNQAQVIKAGDGSQMLVPGKRGLAIDAVVNNKKPTKQAVKNLFKQYGIDDPFNGVGWKFKQEPLEQLKSMFQALQINQTLIQLLQKGIEVLKEDQVGEEQKKGIIRKMGIILGQAQWNLLINEAANKRAIQAQTQMEQAAQQIFQQIGGPGAMTQAQIQQAIQLFEKQELDNNLLVTLFKKRTNVLNPKKQSLAKKFKITTQDLITYLTQKKIKFQGGDPQDAAQSVISHVDSAAQSVANENGQKPPPPVNVNPADVANNIVERQLANLNALSFQDLKQIFKSASLVARSLWKNDARGRWKTAQYLNRPVQDRRVPGSFANFGYGKSFKDKKLNQQLQLLPKAAASLNRQILQASKQKLRSNANTNNFFHDAFDQTALDQGMNITDLLKDKKYWINHPIPKGFSWNASGDSLVYRPSNPNIAQLFPNGISWIQIGTEKKVTKNLDFLASSHISAQKAGQQMDEDLAAILDAAAIVGFQPHYGKISKNSQDLYIGSFVDPLTGNIRLPPKPQLKYFNPVDRNSMTQYHVLKAMYQWNASIAAISQMKNFLDMSQKRWQGKIKLGRRRYNPIQRKRNQIKTIAKKLAMGAKLYGYTENDKPYHNLKEIYQNSSSTPQEINQATNQFMSKVKDYNLSQMNKKIQADEAPQFSNLAHFNAANKFKDRPYKDALKALQRTTIIPIPLNAFGTTVATVSSIGKQAQDLAEKKLEKTKKKDNSLAGLALNNSQAMRKLMQYERNTLQTPLHVTINNDWRQKQYKGQDPQKTVKRNIQLFKNLDTNVLLQQYTKGLKELGILADDVLQTGKTYGKKANKQLSQLILATNATDKPDIWNQGLYVGSYQTIKNRVERLQKAWEQGKKMQAISLVQQWGFQQDPKIWKHFDNKDKPWEQSRFFQDLVDWVVFSRNQQLTNRVITRSMQAKNPLLVKQWQSYLNMGSNKQQKQALIQKLKNRNIKGLNKATLKQLQDLYIKG